jgi:glutaredoxin
MAELHEVIVYTRVQCHLCDVVKESLRRLEHRGNFHWREVDIDGDPELRGRYTTEVPVVYIDGKKAFKFRMDEREFLRKIERD